MISPCPYLNPHNIISPVHLRLWSDRAALLGTCCAVGTNPPQYCKADTALLKCHSGFQYNRLGWKFLSATSCIQKIFIWFWRDEERVKMHYSCWTSDKTESCSSCQSWLLNLRFLGFHLIFHLPSVLLCHGTRKPWGLCLICEFRVCIFNLISIFKPSFLLLLVSLSQKKKIFSHSKMSLNSFRILDCLFPGTTVLVLEASQVMRFNIRDILTTPSIDSQVEICESLCPL